MALQPKTGLETHPAGTSNLAGIINANWQTLEDIAEARGWARDALAVEAYAATIDIALLDGPENTHVEVTGDLTLTFSNLGAGRQAALWLRATGTRALTWPSGMTWLGAAAPATIADGKSIKVEIFCKSATGPDIFAIAHIEA
jgi:hypothetical protein